ncbi:MAG: hypothetical protein NTZ54_09715, partial [Alphaproteobacteria bacterium]|nr:hypothetical protein [Alphaproteobacteria bacterium]
NWLNYSYPTAALGTFGAWCLIRYLRTGHFRFGIGFFGAYAAIVLLDAIVRLLPGVMGKQASGDEESFEGGLLEHPHYTKPNSWEGVEIPGILLSGDHKAIARWKHEQRNTLTKARRPDLWKAHESGKI